MGWMVIGYHSSRVFSEHLRCKRSGRNLGIQLKQTLSKEKAWNNRIHGICARPFPPHMVYSETHFDEELLQQNLHLLCTLTPSLPLWGTSPCNPPCCNPWWRRCPCLSYWNKTSIIADALSRPTATFGRWYIPFHEENFSMLPQLFNSAAF